MLVDALCEFEEKKGSLKEYEQILALKREKIREVEAKKIEDNFEKMQKLIDDQNGKADRRHGLRIRVNAIVHWICVLDHLLNVLLLINSQESCCDRN